MILYGNFHPLQCPLGAPEGLQLTFGSPNLSAVGSHVTWIGRLARRLREGFALQSMPQMATRAGPERLESITPSLKPKYGHRPRVLLHSAHVNHRKSKYFQSCFGVIFKPVESDHSPCMQQTTRIFLLFLKLLTVSNTN